MRKIFIINGLPGSGKGTQAERLANDLDLAHISSGQLIRDVVNSGKKDAQTEEIRSRYNKGIVQPDAIVEILVDEAVKALRPAQGIIFDSFPMSLDQAHFLEKLAEKYSFELPVFIMLNVDPNEVVERISKRRICSKCGFPIIMDHETNSCPECGGELIQRTDDQPEIVKKRIEEYQPIINSLRDYYHGRGRLLEINGSQPINDVYSEMLGRINGK